jgi:hypothetical protein
MRKRPHHRLIVIDNEDSGAGEVRQV